MAGSSDWDQAQRLIERGFCTLDQAREAIALQDRMREMGIAPKPLPQVLLEKGYVSPGQLAEAGLAPRPAPPPVPAPRDRGRPPVALFAGAGAAALIALAVFFLASRGRPLPPPPADPAGADRAAREDLDRIAEFQASAKHFENAEEVVRRYRAFMGRQAGRRGELEAHARLQEYRKRLEEAARPELEAIRGREPGLRAEGRMADLLKLYRAFPAKFLNTTDAGAEAADQAAEISRGMSEAFLSEKEEALRLLAAGRMDEALARVRAMELHAAEDRLKEAEELRARIDREGRTAAARLRRDVGDEYLGLDVRFREAMARRNPREAAAAVGEFLFRPRKDEELRFVRAGGVDYGALRKALDEWRPAEVAAICDAAATDRERPEPPQAALLDLRGAAYVTLFLDEAARAHRAAAGSGPLGSLGEEELAALGMRSAPEDAARHAQAGFFYYYAGKGLQARAYEHLSRAREKGARGIQPYLANLAAAIEAERGRALEVKLGAAGDCIERKQWIPAKALLEEILREPDHPFAKAHASRIDRMHYEATQGLLAEKRFAEVYRGKVEPLEGGALRVTYDFEDRGQLEAFEVVAEEERLRLKGRWKVEGGALESGYATSAVRWRTPVKGDVAVEYDLTPLEEPQNIVLALYNAKGQGRHYAVVFGFDWVGKSEGDLDNSAEDRFGMPRTCVLKYPVAVEKGRWREEAAWEAWASRLAGKAAEPWRPVRGKTARVRVDRRGKGIRVEADGKAIWEGEDGAYSEGHLLFFSDCRCRVDNLAITFRP